MAFGAYGADVGKQIAWVDDGTIIVGGTTGSFGSGASDIYLMWLDGDGFLTRSATIGGAGVDEFVDMEHLPNGDLLVVANSNSGGDYDGMLVRTDPLGNVIWQQTYGSDDWDFFRDLLVLDTGEMIVVGQSFRPGVDGEVWVIRMNDTGAMSEEWLLGGDGVQDGRSICRVPDGFAMAGSTGAGDGSDALLIRVGEDGSVLWTHTFGGDSLDMVNDVVATSDGGFSMVGTTHSYSPWEEAYHVKVDGDGNEVWFRNWGQINDQGAMKHLELPNGEFVSIGYTKTSGGGAKDMFLLRSAANGDFIFGRTYGGEQDDVGYGLDVTNDGFVCTGWTSSYGAGGRDVFVVRTDGSGVTQSEQVGTHFDPLEVEEHGTVPLVFMPNPSCGVFWLSGQKAGVDWVVHDGSGRTVVTGRTAANEPIVVRSEPGVYFIEIVDGAAMRRQGRLVIIDR
jgi:hypothetical protein